MSYFRKFTAAISALAVASTSVFTFSVAVAATTFTDASGIASWASASVTSLADSGVLSGRPDGSFDPQGQLNRAEMAKVAMLAAGLTEDTTGAPHFNDIASSDWYYSFVETLYNNGVVGGVNGGALDSNGLATYNPGGTLNRAEGSKILVDAFELETAYAGTPPNFPDVASSAWYFDYVETAYAHGLVGGYANGNFGPGDAITREQVAVIAQSSIEEAADGSKRRATYTAGAASSVEPSDDDDDDEIVASDGTLTVSKSSSAPADQTFPKGTSSTAVAAYNFTATGDDIVVTGLVIDRSGVGEESDWTLYLYDGANRLTNGKTINSTTQQATFTNVGLTVPAGTTKTVILKADTSTSSTGGESYFEIVAADSVTSNAKSVSGSFSVKSNKNEINTSITSGSITVEKNGSITNPKVGEDNVTVAKFKLTSATEAAVVEQLAFLVDGSIASGDLQNAKLYQSDTLLGSVAAVNSQDLLVFEFNTPYEIAKGDSRNFEIKADLNTGRSGDTVEVYVDEATDIVAKGGTYGFGLSVDLDNSNGYDGTTCTSSSNLDCSFSTLQGGDVTISSSGPTADDVAINGDDIVLMDFDIASVSEVTIEKFAVSITMTELVAAGGLLNTTTDNVTDIKIVDADTGATLMGPIEASVLKTALGGSTAITEAAGDDAAAYYVFQDEFMMSAGEERNLQLTVDVENNSSLSGDTIIGRLEIDTTYPTIKDINNKVVTNTASVVPSSDITGKTMTVRSPTLTVTKSSTPDTDTFVKGTSEVCFVGLSLQAGDASDITVTEIAVAGAIDNDANDTYNEGTGATDASVALKDVVGSVSLYEGSTLIGSSESVQTDGTATFDNLSYDINAGATVQIKVCGDISSSVTGTPSIKFGVAASSFTVEDEDSNTVSSIPAAAVNTSLTVDETAMSISQGGTLTVAVDADTSKEDIVVAGTSNVDISEFKISATDEDFVVTKFSINNRQDGVASTDLGEYDDNVTEIQISYTNSDGATESKDGYLANGIASFSGLDVFVEKDDDAVISVTASLNTISAGADAATFVDLNIAFNNFEAVAQGSGETYAISKIDAGSGALSFGTISYTDPSSTAVGTLDTVTLGSTEVLVITDQDVTLPVGTIILIDDDGTYDSAASSIIVLTEKYDDGDLTITGVVADDADGVDAADLLYYALPGQGYLTASNQMHVYESKPTIALSSTSPSGSRSQNASDGVFIFTIAADAQEKVAIRAAQVNDATAATTDFQASALDGTFTGTDALTTVTTGGVGDSAFQRETSAGVDAAGITYTMTAADLSGYEGMSFWVRSSDNANTLTMTVNGGATDDTQASAALVTDTWQFVDMLFDSGTAADYQSVTTLALTVTDASAVSAATYDLDRITLYTEKVTVDLASDASMTAASNAQEVLLKQGGSTVAIGYAYISSTSVATVTLTPVSGTYNDIEISKGSSKTFTVQTDTTTLITGESGTDDLLTLSMDLGSSSNGTVTAGDLWWYETNATVKWLGQVDDSTLSSNTLKY